MTNHNHSNFWFGFLLGAGASCTALYFFGTKKGRTQLKHAIDATENIEETVDDVLEALDPTSQTSQSATTSSTNSSIFSKVTTILHVLFGHKEKKHQSAHAEQGTIL